MIFELKQPVTRYVGHFCSQIGMRSGTWISLSSLKDLYNPEFFNLYDRHLESILFEYIDQSIISYRVIMLGHDGGPLLMIEDHKQFNAILSMP